MAKLTLIQAINDALRVAMRQDSTVVLLGEDIGINGGVFRATDGLIQEFGPERVIDCPLAESGYIGAAIGMAVNGLKPVAEVQFDGFLAPAHEQVANHLSRIRHRSRGRFTCPMVIRIPSWGGIKALEHHSESIENWYLNIPGLKMVAPSNPYDAKGLLLAAIADPDPVLYMEPKRLYRAFRAEVPEGYYTVPLGQAAVVREGTDMTVLTYGVHVHTALEAAEQAASQYGWQAEVIDLRSLNPLDLDTIIGSVKKTGRAVVVSEAPRTGGFHSELVALINDHALEYLEAPVARVTGFDVPMPYLLSEDLYIPDAGRVLEAMQAVRTY
ncbi:alpha-ketoacid dehydrogenase subunit beta [Symbiobacterium thermophilum]|uniref:Alpha-ketoacid dehydrogenase subunit beta n=1 Tax=Symbiobacterium thermophilum TaxID=2734 RepID=A0A953I5Q2_SYMTR|nr:alpha-ketoacid dehydrogenase subunit beta [Symbiobacterium thermophilum]MBY6277347.1 alpha-ketoacid dehydrogenase subunit beta [Symbiobacterium thermophilum]